MVELILLQPADREQFIKDNQWAFKYGALEEFVKRNDQFEEDDEIIARQTIENCIDQGTAYRIWQNGQKAGGAVVSVKGDRGSLELLFVNPTIHSRGIGYAAWRAIEQMYPKVKVWETITPYFETRNIHFYVNKCGFKIVEFYNPLHPEPSLVNVETGDTSGTEEWLDFRFEKRME